MTWTASPLCGSKPKAEPLCSTAFIKFIDLTCILKTESQMEWEVGEPIRSPLPCAIGRVGAGDMVGRLEIWLVCSRTRFLEKTSGLVFVSCKDETNAKVEGSRCLELDFLPREALFPTSYRSLLTRLQLRPPPHSTLRSPAPAQNAPEVSCHSRLEMNLNCLLDIMRNVSIFFLSPVFCVCVWGGGGGTF